MPGQLAFLMHQIAAGLVKILNFPKITVKSGPEEGKTTAEMMQQSTFVGWDFVHTWSIDEGVDYPRLQWEVE